MEIIEKISNREFDFTMRAFCIEEYANHYFYEDENGKQKYTPHYSELGQIVIFGKYYLTGVEFDKNEKGTVSNQSYLDQTSKLLDENEQVKTLFEHFKSFELSKIQDYVDDIVDFRKQELLHAPTSIDKKVRELLDKESKRLDAETEAIVQVTRLNKAQSIQIEASNELNEHLSIEQQVAIMEKISVGEMDFNDMAKHVADNYLSGSEHSENITSVLEEKNNKIAELKAYKNANEARNVLNK